MTIFLNDKINCRGENKKMNSEETADNSTVTMEETIQSHDDSKVPEHEAIKKELSSWIEIKGISDKSDDLNEIKTEKNETGVKNEDDRSDSNAVENNGDVEHKNKTDSTKVEATDDERNPPENANNEVNTEQKTEPKSPVNIENKIAVEVETIVATDMTNIDEDDGKKSDDRHEETETIQLIEETILIPEATDEVEKTDETIEYNVIEYTETTAINSSLPLKKSISQTSLQNLVEMKKRSLLDDIFDDWRDENPDDEEKDSSGKVDDAVEDQLKNLLQEKTTSTKSVESKYDGSSSPRNSETIKLVSSVSESVKILLNDGNAEKIVEKRDEEHKSGQRNVTPVEDSKELLAILEGDVEPDWSNLRSTLDTSKTSDNSKSIKPSSSPILDPLVERQVALKQLLELPMSPEASKSPPSTVEETKTEETRSGRKRKPTEKAREHEITAKRQKILKSKSPQAKKTLAVNKITEATTKSGKSEANEEVLKENLSQKVPVKEKKTIGKKMVRKAMPRAIKTSMKKASKGLAVTDGVSKPRKKSVNEIDRLLQDEGVVNLLYDVEHPEKRRLVPVTKSQVKVMDIQKVQRELRIRTKFVKSAVLRLRTSATSGPKSPRAKRSSSSSVSIEEIPVAQESAKSNEFLFPARIRNAADASVIVRRHSSSSFSSASGSPRVSFDSTDKQSDEAKSQNYTGKNNKRTIAQEDKTKTKAVETKKAKRISTPLKGKDVDNHKKAAVKQDEELPEKSNGTPAKIVKPKKNLNKNNKVTFAKSTTINDNDTVIESPNEEEEDELSACLAEAVTALANDSSNRAKNSMLNRKAKHKGKDPTKVQFTNKEINVQRHGHLVQLIITPSITSKIRNAMTLPMMQELRDVLAILKKDDNCRVVLLTSTGSSFCEGLELSTLLEENQDVRRANAQLLANAVKDFIKSLATFNKPIVAGVQGSAVGLGVTMLPLFDLVIASDKASFSTPYGKLGQIAEGAAVFTLSHVLGSAVTSELLLGGRTLTANEALRAGLVTRVLWPDRFHVELLPSLRAMSEQSSQSMEATKALLRHSLRTKLAAALESESYLLIQHWCSNECQNAIRAYMDEKVQ